MADDVRALYAAGKEPYADHEKTDARQVAEAQVSDPSRGAGTRQDQVGLDLDMQHASYGRDGGSQDRFQDTGGEFGQAGIDATTGRGSREQ